MTRVLLLVVVVVVLLLMLGMMRNEYTRLAGRSRRSKDTRRDNETLDTTRRKLWARDVEHLHAVEREYTEFEMDPFSILRRPLLADVSVPTTETFHRALYAAQGLSAALGDPDTDPVPGQKYLDKLGEKVSAVMTAWIAANNHARMVGVPTTTERERRRLRQAEEAMKRAVDGRTAPAERRLALERVQELIAELIDIPMPAVALDKVVAAIEHEERRALGR